VKAQALDLQFSRVQFTPDLMPSDITGTELLEEDHATGRRFFKFVHGPVFGNVVLADEINRAPPKTQAALLQAMQEHAVTAAGKTHRLPEPFIVLATQNPIEQEGTYPLPEAQLDRFLFKLLVPFTTRDELNRILDRTTRNENPLAGKVMDASEITQWQALVREVLVAAPVQDYAIRLLLSTHPQGEFATADANRYLRCGASPRGAQALILAGKVRALLEGRYNVSFEDVRKVYFPAMRHRVLLNFEAQAENVSTDTVLATILNEVKEKEDGKR
jgi:MoxR-like ATPase